MIRQPAIMMIPVFLMLLTPIIVAQPIPGSGQPANALQELSANFWEWRAAEQPFSFDDIPRLDRPRGWAADWSPSTIAKHLSLSERTVYRFVKLFTLHGTILPRPSIRGPSRLLTGGDLDYLRLLLRENTDFYLDELADKMTTFLGRRVSKSLIWKSLEQMGYRYKQVSINYTSA